MSAPAIACAALHHRYGDRAALAELDLCVQPGELFGLLGPNGSGKTTLFRILTTLMPPTGGTARLFGHDTVTAGPEVRRLLGVVFQQPSLDRKLTAAENLRHHGRLYGLGGATLAQRSAAALARVGLAERADELVEDFSGGLRRRVELAKGLLHEPQLLLLDEPSSGLDVGARLDLWRYLAEIRADGVTSLVATHLMEEAERCDRLAILDEGKLVALGTPAELRAEIGGALVSVETTDAALAGGLAARFGVEVAADGERLRFPHAEAAALVAPLMAEFGPRVRSVSVGAPTLEDVFIQRTGHRFWSAER